MPYFKGGYTNNEQEKEVEKIIKELNIEYVLQPNGNNASPDIHLFVPRKNELELKSAKNGVPSWNDGMPEEGRIYCQCSKKHNSTIIYRGEDIMTDKEREIIRDCKEEVREVVAKHNDRLRQVDHYLRGWQLYPRTKLQQQNKHNSDIILDYWEHPDKESNISKCRLSY